MLYQKLNTLLLIDFVDASSTVNNNLSNNAIADSNQRDITEQTQFSARFNPRLRFLVFNLFNKVYV